MKYSNTAIRELSAKYRSILKKCALLNALILISSFSMSAGAITIDKNTVTPIYDEEDKEYTYETTAEDYANFKQDTKLKIDNTGLDGTLKVYSNSSVNNVENFIITSDETVELIGSKLMANNGLTISGGVVNATGSSLNSENEAGINAKRIDISGGEINLVNADLNNDSTTGFYMTDGTINMETTANGVTSSQIGSEGDRIHEGEPDEALVGGKVLISGGTINVKGGSNTTLGDMNHSNYLMGEDITISGGELNILENSTLKVANNLREDPNNAEMGIFDKSTIKLQGEGEINLAGILQANIDKGTSAGTLNINNSNAQVIGSVDNVNLSVNSDFNLNNIGTLGKLGTVNVTSGKTLTLGKHLKSTTALIKQGAILDLGINTLETGTVTIADNATVNFRVSGKDQFGHVVADTINISENGTALNLTLDTGVLAKDESKDFQIFEGTVDGEFAKLSENARYKFSSKGNGLYTITGEATSGDIISEIGGDANDKAVASAWLDAEAFKDGSGAANVANHLNQLSQLAPQAFKEAVKALQPDTAPTAQATASAVNNQIAGAVAGRFGGPAPQGHSAGDTFKNAGLWAQGLLNKSKLDKSNGFDGKTNGLAMGIDGEVAEGLKIGMGYAYTTSDIDATGRNTDVDTHTGILYAEKALGNAFVNGVLTYGRSSYKEDKNVGGLGVSADYDADAIFTQLMTGYTFGNSNWTLTPETGVRYLWTKTHAYTDTADQHVASNTTDTWTGVLGARTSFPIQVKSMTFVPELKLAATYDIKNDKAGSFVTLANGSSYATTGEALNRFGVETGAKLSTTVGNTEWSLNYEGKFRKDYTDHTGMVNFKYNF